MSSSFGFFDTFNTNFWHPTAGYKYSKLFTILTSCTNEDDDIDEHNLAAKEEQLVQIYFEETAYFKLMDMIQWIRSCLRMFYIALPADYEREDDGHNILLEAWPFFALFIVLENVILLAQRKSTVRFNDGVTSIAHGIFYESARLLTRGMENCFYARVHYNYKIVDLCWSNLLTWYMAAIIVDFFYYWVHRASHEIHILWAQHQVHHSSEDYNLTVGLRHPFLHNWCGFLIYLPLAFFIPPAQFLIHQQISLLYQFWMHTSTIETLGLFELIFNTPRHHRAHHGSNKKFLDKNYGGFLIIWDRLFGTFTDYESSETITYGLVVQPKSFNPLYLQIFYNKNLYTKFRRLPGWMNKFQSLIKGPSWLPGRPWTGCDSEKIDVHERNPYNPALHPCIKLYLGLHFIFCLYFFYCIVTLSQTLSSPVYYTYFFYIFFSFVVFGMFFDGKPSAVILEAIRCCFSCLLSYHINMPLELLFWLQIAFGMSAAWWVLKVLEKYFVASFSMKA